MNDLQLYVPLNCISVISSRRESDNERLCAMESRLQLERLPPPAGSNSVPLEQ